MTRIHIVLLVVLSCVCLFSANGSSKFQIGNDLVKEFTAIVSKKAIIEVNKLRDNIPGLNLDLSPARFLPFKINITNLKFEEIIYRDDEVQIYVNDASKLIKLKLNNFNLKATSDYADKFLLFKHKGSVDLDLDFSLELDLKFKITENNFLNFSVQSITIDHKFNKLSISGDFLLSLIFKEINLFKKIINWGLKKGLTPIMTTLIGKFNSILENQLVLPGFNSTVAIQFLEEPIFTDDFFEMDLNFEIQDKIQGLKFLQKPLEKMLFKDIKLDLDPEIKDLIKLSIEKNLMNDLASEALKNFRNFTITNDVIPKEIPFKINTLYFQSLIPEMYQKYPNKDLIIYLGIDSFPEFNVNSTDVSVNTNIMLDIAFSLLEDPSNIFLSLSTNTFIDVIFDSLKEDNAIHFSLNKVEIQDAIILISVFDDISADQMKEDMNTFFTSFFYFVNNYLRMNPIKIPVVGGVSLEKININVIEDKYLQLKLKPAMN